MSHSSCTWGLVAIILYVVYVFCRAGDDNVFMTISDIVFEAW